MNSWRLPSLTIVFFLPVAEWDHIKTCQGETEKSGQNQWTIVNNNMFIMLLFQHIWNKLSSGDDSLPWFLGSWGSVGSVTHLALVGWPFALTSLAVIGRSIKGAILRIGGRFGTVSKVRKADAQPLTKLGWTEQCEENLDVHLALFFQTPALPVLLKLHISPAIPIPFCSWNHIMAPNSGDTGKGVSNMRLTGSIWFNLICSYIKKMHLKCLESQTPKRTSNKLTQRDI